MMTQPINIAQMIRCKDGFKVSVQAGWSHYCSPRENYDRAYGLWSEYEVGYPSEVVPEFLPYAEDPETPLASVYAYVPRQFIIKAIEKHGGPVFEPDKTLRNWEKNPTDWEPRYSHMLTILKSLGFEEVPLCSH